jgi:predicted nucleotidyltransferase
VAGSRARKGAKFVAVPLVKIQGYANQIVKLFKPKKIILFGSYAYGQPTADSDVDILVIMPFDPRKGRKSLEIRQTVRAEFPLDLLVRQPKVVSERLRRGDMFLQEITDKGLVLYKA